MLTTVIVYIIMFSIISRRNKRLHMAVAEFKFYGHTLKIFHHPFKSVSRIWLRLEGTYANYESVLIDGKLRKSGM